MTCTYRKWDISGIPCKHAVAAIYKHGQNGGCGIPEAWVDNAYKVETWKAIYVHKINRINSSDIWVHIEGLPKMLPPTYHAPLGRPRKVRKRARVDEPAEAATDGTRLSKKGSIMTCDTCGNPGHNRRTCKGQGGEQNNSAQPTNVKPPAKKKTTTAGTTSTSKKSIRKGNGASSQVQDPPPTVTADMDPTKTPAFQAMQQKRDAANPQRKPMFINGVMFMSSQPTGHERNPNYQGTSSSQP